VRTDGADRVGDPWDELLRTPVPGADPDVDDELEAALLSYKQRRAARWGAERFAEELRRRDEAEEHRQVWTSEALAAPVEASVESQVVDGKPATFRPEPPGIGFDASFLVTKTHPSIPEVVEQEVAEERAPATAAEPVKADEPVAVEGVPDEVPPVDDVPEEVAPVEVALPEVAPREIVPEPVAAAVPVAGPRFVPDQAWSAGAASSKRLPAAIRHPHVPRPPKPEPVSQTQPKRRWRDKRGQPEPERPARISAPDWARMSPGARRLYGFDESDEERRAG
jgi:hypothetical protein